MKATQEKSLHQTSELHAKELEVLQSQVNKLKEELSSSRDKSQELEKLVSELQAYKERAQVSTDCHIYTLWIFKSSFCVIDFYQSLIIISVTYLCLA